MPVLTTLLPTAASIGGAAAGAALSNHGALNIRGVNEGIASRKTELNTITDDLRNKPMDEETRRLKKTRAQSLENEIGNRQKRLDWMSTGPMKSVFSNPRINRMGVITGGLIGGAALGGLTQLTANLIEKRRRDEEAERGI